MGTADRVRAHQGDHFTRGHAKGAAELLYELGPRGPQVGDGRVVTGARVRAAKCDGEEEGPGGQRLRLGLGNVCPHSRPGRGAGVLDGDGASRCDGVGERKSLAEGGPCSPERVVRA